MKKLISGAAVTLLIMLAVGCSKKENVTISTDISVTAIAAGAKTKAGKLVDVYEVQIAKKPSLILVVGGGKLATSSQCLLSLDGQMLEANPQTINNAVLIVEKTQSGFLPIPGMTPAEAKAKCPAGGVIDLPVDETLAARPPAPGSM